MPKTTDSTAEVIQTYRHRAKRYDFTVSWFNLFRRFGFDLEGWRGEAVQALALKRGDTVVDIGCGTGLNFWLLEQAIGPEGKIIGVDLSEAMLTRGVCRGILTYKQKAPHYLAGFSWRLTHSNG